MNKKIEKILTDFGRSPVEIKVGDIYITTNYATFLIYDNDFLEHLAKEDFTDDQVIGFIPKENIKWVN